MRGVTLCRLRLGTLEPFLLTRLMRGVTQTLLYEMPVV